MIHWIDHPRAQRPDSLVHSQAPSPHSTTPHRASSPVCQPFTPWFPRHVSKVQGLNHWLQCPSPNLAQAQQQPHLLNGCHAGLRAPRHFTALMASTV